MLQLCSYTCLKAWNEPKESQPKLKKRYENRSDENLKLK